MKGAHLDSFKGYTKETNMQKNVCTKSGVTVCVNSFTICVMTKRGIYIVSINCYITFLPKNAAVTA